MESERLLPNDFKTKSVIESSVNFIQPSQNKLYIKVEKNSTDFYGSDWFGIDWEKEDAPFYGIAEDSLLLRTVRVDVNKSKDSLYHIKIYKFSRGKNPVIAKNNAQAIDFEFKQTDSIITLPQGFIITKNNKFRNQQILVVIEVPYGKKIKLDEALGNYNWFELNYNKKNNLNISLDRNKQRSLQWDEDVEMIMGEKDLINPNDKEDNNDDLRDIEKEQKDLDKRRKEIIRDTLKTIQTSNVIKNNTTILNNTNTASKQFYLCSILMDRF